MTSTPEGPGAYRPRLTRAAMSALAPDADAALLDAAGELLEPLWPLLEDADDGVGESALAFDPVLAAGGTPPAYAVPGPPPAAAPGPPDDGLPWLAACDLAGLVRDGRLDAAEAVRVFARRIVEIDPRLNSFITPTAGLALKQAREEPRGRLAGVPIGLKDLVDTAGVRTTCGSAVHETRVPAADAACWRRLRGEGALLMGKLNTHEFAAGVTSENDRFGPVRNPWDPARVAGGSSGGSAAAVCAGLVTASVGTDTGGSVRIPASCCGVVGLKPTFGLVPADGVAPLAWSLDHVGPLARTVRDAALLLDVMAGTSCEPAARAGAAGRLDGLRVGVPTGWLDGTDDEVRASFTEATATLERCGARLVELPDAPATGPATAVNRIIAYAEGSAAHDRLLRSEAAGYGPRVRPRKEAGRFVLAGQYLAAQRLRGALCRSFAAQWLHADVLVSPTLPCRVPEAGAATVRVAGGVEPVGTALVRHTGPFNLAGLPAITLASGYDGDGLPIGLQIAGPPLADPLVCFAAAAFETARTTPVRRPGGWLA